MKNNSNWIPAFAGMTVITLFFALPLQALESVHTPEDRILAKAFSSYMDGHDKIALNYFEEVLRINPSNSAARKGMEKVKVRMKKKENAELARAKHLAKAKVKEAKEFMKSDDMVGAIDSLHAALDAVPEFKGAVKEMNNIRRKNKALLKREDVKPSVWAFSRGVLAYMDRDWAKAYRLWSERVAIEPDNVALINANARAEKKFIAMMNAEREDFFRRSAREFYERGLYQESTKAWDKVLALQEDDLEALEGKSRAESAHLAAIGKGRDTEFQKMLEDGLQLYATEKWDKALATFEQLVKMDPDFSTPKEFIALINKKLNSAEYRPIARRTKSNWRETRESNQGLTKVVVPDSLTNFAERRAQLESQLKRDPGNIRLSQELDKIMKMQEDESERMYKDGLISYSQGNRGLAIDKWKQVLVIDPDHKKAAAALRKARAEEERSEDDLSP